MSQATSNHPEPPVNMAVRTSRAHAQTLAEGHFALCEATKMNIIVKNSVFRIRGPKLKGIHPASHIAIARPLHSQTTSSRNFMMRQAHPDPFHLNWKPLGPSLKRLDRSLITTTIPCG